jgi:hypothetical protein
MNADDIPKRFRTRRTVFLSTFDDAPSDTKLDMFLNLYLDDAVAAVDLFFDSIAAKVDVTVRPQFVQSEQKLAIENLSAPSPCIRQCG